LTAKKISISLPVCMIQYSAVADVGKFEYAI
jgi:hypothetical protein